MLFSRHLPRVLGLGLALSWGLCLAQDRAFDYPINSHRLFLLNLAQSGQRLVAVGERGVVLLSDDQAASWRSVRTPSTRTLAAVAFDNPQVGVAVGHGGTLLRTSDGGQSWSPVEADTNGDALLGVMAVGQGRMVAWGAFGLYLTSNDAGASWERRSVVDESFDRHISQITRLADGRWLLVGESGTLAASADQGMTWSALQSPYPGSFFGVLQTADGALIAYGMRGNLWISRDNGNAWQKRETGTTLAFNGAVQLASGRILVFGNSGVLMASDDQGQNFRALPTTRASLAKARQLADGRLLAVGDQGVMIIQAQAAGGGE